MKSHQQKVKEAVERDSRRRKRTIIEQLEMLNLRPGSSLRERERLAKPPTHPPTNTAKPKTEKAAENDGTVTTRATGAESRGKSGRKKRPYVQSGSFVNRVVME